MVKKHLKKILDSLGYEIHRKDILETHYQIDPYFNNLYEKAQQKTQMTLTDNTPRRQRHYVLNYLIQNVDFSKGDICEAGCWRGLSVYQIASYIKAKKIDVKFHVFDSFEGLSEFQPEDYYNDEGRSIESIKKQFACSMTEVKYNLKEFDFIEYYKGWIPDRFPEVAHKTFSFVHIDVDLYQPIYDSIAFFYPRLVPTGIMVFDDYGCLHFPGAKKAVDEFLQKTAGDFFLPLPSGQAFLVKSVKD